MKGVIFDIKRFAIHDGPGIRTTVFMKGCPLTCAWCHNPESRDICITDLPDGSGRTVGYSLSPENLLSIIIRDRVFYDHSGGGVTFSGGEPLFQSEFLTEMLSLCRQAGIHTAVDTSGYASREVLEKIIPWTDLFLFDLKHLDEARHFSRTSVSNRPILDNLERLNSLGARIWIRIPLVPGFNDSQDHIERLIHFIRPFRQVEQVNVLPYHRMGSRKYRMLRFPEAVSEFRQPDREALKVLKEKFEKHGLPCQIGG